MPVNFNLSEPIVTSNTAKVQLICQKESHTNATVTIELLPTAEQGVNTNVKNYKQSVACDGNPMNLQYNYLNESTIYYIASVWNVNNGTYYCKMTQFITGKLKSCVRAFPGMWRTFCLLYDTSHVHMYTCNMHSQLSATLIQ